MSGAVTSAWLSPNDLYSIQSAEGQREANQLNTLLQPYKVQEAQQQVAGNEMDMMGRASLGLLSLPDEASRAAAYPGVVADLQKLGYAKNAPSQYPGEGALRGLVSQAVPVAQQYQYGMVSNPELLKQLQQIYSGASGGGGGGGTDPISGLPVEKALPALEARESGGRNIDTQILGPDGKPASTASGYYQMIDPTFQEGMKLAGIPGTWTHAKDAPREVQTAAANAIYQKYGVAPWAASNPNRGTKTASTSGTTVAAQGPGGSVVVQQGGEPPAPPGGPSSAPVYAGGGIGTVLQPSTVQQGGAPPAPPGGSGAAYTGGGIGSVLDPNRVVVKGSPVPAGNVRADVGAIQQGMQLAQTGPQPPSALVAGPAAPTTTAPTAPAKPEGFGTSVGAYNDLPTIPAAPQNALTLGQPGAPAAPAAQSQQQPAAPGSRVALPHASEIPSGMQSQQVQQAQAMLGRATQLEIVASQAPPNSPTARAAAAMAADLKARAQVLMQTDSVVQTQEGQFHPLTGKLDNPATPNANYVFSPDAGGPGVPGFIDTTNTHEPKISPARRLVQRPDGTVIDDTGRIVSPADLPGAQAAAAAKASGTAMGGDIVKQTNAIYDQGREADRSIANIDYGLNQLNEASKAGIPSGYFSPALATAAAAAKSLGIDTKPLGVDPASVSSVQTAQKTLAVVAAAILQQALGSAQITDAKVEHYVHTQPGLENDPQALQKILGWARTQFVYESEMARAGAKAAAANNGYLPQNFRAQYYQDHGYAPIYNPGSGETEQPDGRAPPRQPAPTPPTYQPAPQAPAARTAGTTYQTPKGPMKWTGTGWLPAQ